MKEYRVFNGYSISALQDGKLLEMDGDDGWVILIPLISLNCMLKGGYDDYYVDVYFNMIEQFDSLPTFPLQKKSAYIRAVVLWLRSEPLTHVRNRHINFQGIWVERKWGALASFWLLSYCKEKWVTKCMNMCFVVQVSIRRTNDILCSNFLKQRSSNTHFQL